MSCTDGFPHCQPGPSSNHEITFRVEGVTREQAEELFDLANTAVHDNIPVGTFVVPQLISYED